MSIIGYIRVSSQKQTLEHQHYEIEQFAQKNKIKINQWVEEKISSRKALKNRKLGSLLDSLQEGDILIACEISRLGRSLLEVMRILEICLSKNCKVWTLKENYRLGKASGKKLGRPFSAESKKLKLSKSVSKIQQLLSKGCSKTEIAQKLNVQRSTLQRFMKNSL